MKRGKPRTWLALLSVLLGTLVLAGRVQAQTKVRVGKAVGEAFSFVPLDVGMQEGTFRKHGIQVEEYDFGGDAKLQQALMANSIDIGLGSGPGLAFEAKGVPVIGVAAMANAPRLLVLAVAKNGPIHTVNDLKGKIVSVSTEGSVTNWLVHELADKQGWGTDGIRTLPVGTDAAQISALETHQVAGIVVDIAAAYRLEDAGQVRILVRFGDLFPNFIIHVIFASRSFANQHPDAVRNFLAGWFETIDYMQNHKANTVAIAARVMGVSPSIASRVYDELMPMFNRNGRFDPKALAVLQRSFVQMGILSTEPDMSKLVTEKYLPNPSAK
ncbi:MAG TPA: ABC transporter substrate-binding protein [Patescibacteria group bacterium]|nr:ABC transporter substrate-binding protein [Patescibacteria group bacterium]